MDRSEYVRGLPPLGSLIRHQFGIILAGTALALGLGGLYANSLPLTYTADSVVLLSPVPGNPLTAETASGSAVQMTVALETEAQLIRTPAVAVVVTASLGREIPEPDEILSVSVPSNTQMLAVSFTSTTPEAAQNGAQGFAEGYLEFRGERARLTQEVRVERLMEQIDMTEADLQAADAAATGGTSGSTHEVQLLFDRLAQLNSSLSATEAVSVDPGSVIRAAEMPESSNELPPWVILAASGVVGLFVGLGLALLREWRRDLLRPSEREAGRGAAILADIRPDSRPRLVTDADPALHEAYRQLRTAVIARGPRPQALAFAEVLGRISPDVGLAAAEVATNLAIVLAEAKFSVLLVSTPMRSRGVERLLDLGEGDGLAESVAGSVSPWNLLVKTHGISVLPAGRDAPGSRDTTSMSSFRAMVDDLYPRFDYMILAAGAAGSSEGDAVLLSADSAILVVEPGTTTRSLLNVTLERLEGLGVMVAGAVMVGRPTRSSKRVNTTNSRPQVASDVPVHGASRHGE